MLVRGKYWGDEDAFLTVGHDEKVVRILDGLGEEIALLSDSRYAALSAVYKEPGIRFWNFYR